MSTLLDHPSAVQSVSFTPWNTMTRSTVPVRWSRKTSTSEVTTTVPGPGTEIVTSAPGKWVHARAIASMPVVKAWSCAMIVPLPVLPGGPEGPAGPCGPGITTFEASAATATRSATTVHTTLTFLRPRVAAGIVDDGFDCMRADGPC